MKQIPTDVDNFVTLINEDYYYIDKTQYIPLLEQKGKFILFVRPSGMGKTLFSSMLMTYYDINYRKQFEHFFGGLNISNEPTPNVNNFFILNLDFSQIKSDLSIPNRKAENLLKKLCQSAEGKRRI